MGLLRDKAGTITSALTQSPITWAIIAALLAAIGTGYPEALPSIIVGSSTLLAALAFKARRQHPPSDDVLIPATLMDDKELTLTPDYKLLVEKHAARFLKVAAIALTVLAGGGAIAAWNLIRDSASEIATRVANDTLQAARDLTLNAAKSAAVAELHSKDISKLREDLKDEIRSHVDAAESTRRLIQKDLVDAEKIKGILTLVDNWDKLATTVSDRAYEALDNELHIGRDLLSAFIVPPGTIVAWPFEMPNAIRAHWRVCDGLSVSKADCDKTLFEQLGATYGWTENGEAKLPNLQGYFLRGVGSQTLWPAQSRTAAAGRKATPSGPGSTELDGTALPRTAFEASGGTHTHTSKELLPNRELWNGNKEPRIAVAEADPLDNSGSHSHTISRAASKGGDDQTRPYNVAVYWVMRIK